MVVGLGVPVTLSDTGGVDLLNFSWASSGVAINLGRASGQWQQVLAGQAKLALSGIFEDVVGTPWDDTIRGNSAKNHICGWDGDDSLYGGAGDDWLYGGAGNDKLFGEAGNDVLLGGEGNDQHRCRHGQ